jgi:hypothetical protein
MLEMKAGLIAVTRREYVHVGSTPASLRASVTAINPAFISRFARHKILNIRHHTFRQSFLYN